MAELGIVKRLLGITDKSDKTLNCLLENIMDMVEAQLQNRLGGVREVPEELDYIVHNVTISRYNQLGDEGKSSMTVEGESASWLTDLFAPFEEDIQRYLDRTNGTVSGGSITFL